MKKKPSPKKTPAKKPAPKVPLAAGAKKPPKLGGLGRLLLPYSWLHFQVYERSSCLTQSFY